MPNFKAILNYADRIHEELPANDQLPELLPVPVALPNPPETELDDAIISISDALSKLLTLKQKIERETALNQLREQYKNTLDELSQH